MDTSCVSRSAATLYCLACALDDTTRHDTVKPPSKYTKEEFHNNVLPRAAENQPPRVLNDLRQLSCRLVASGISKGLLNETDLPEIRRILVSRFKVCWAQAAVV